MQYNKNSYYKIKKCFFKQKKKESVKKYEKKNLYSFAKYFYSIFEY